MSAGASIEMRQHFVAASTADLTDGEDRISATFLSKQHHYINVTDRQGVPSPTKNDRPGTKKGRKRSWSYKK